MYRFLIFIAVGLLTISGCTTTKSKSDISKRKRFYHNTTAKYNGYFNANEIVELSLLEIAETNQDNYTQLLPLNPYGYNYDALNYTPKMDTAIGKVTRVVALHPESQWVDDCYVLMGKAQYIKRDYESAEETFEYFKEEFDFSRYHEGRNKVNKRLTKQEKKKARKQRQKERDQKKKEQDKERKEQTKEREQDKKDRAKSRKEQLKDRKKSKKKNERSRTKSREEAAKGVKYEQSNAEKKAEAKKKEEAAKKAQEEKKEDDKKKDDDKKNKYKGGHTPAYYEGAYWLAKTYSQRERFSIARYMFNSLLEEKEVPKKLKRKIPLALAEMFIIKKDYPEAISSLDEAIALEKKKQLKSRYSYIQAQLYEKDDNAAMALQALEKVTKYNPDFEMQFSADVNKILLRQKMGDYTQDQALKKLDKMLKEEKYDSYQGEIYFAKGQAYYRGGDIENALAHFQYSIDNSSNPAFKTEAYYTMAKLFYDSEQYGQSKYYYDSTLLVMPKTDYRYADAKLYSESLELIAKNIEIVQKQDSLLTLAQLSDDELQVYAEQILDAQNAEKKAGNQAENSSVASSQVRLNAGSFFAYNPKSVERGRRAFQDVWGTRQLSNNWRTDESSDIEAEIDAASSSSGVYTDIQINSVLKGIPRTKAQQQHSKKKMQEAMFDLGRLYKDKLKNNEASFAMYKKLYDEHPDFQPMDELLFSLHWTAKDLGKSGQANNYKKKLIKDFPESKYAKLLADPNYAKELMAELNAPEAYYEQTCQLFEQGKYQKVITRAKESKDVLAKDKTLQAKMAMLNAMSYGKVEGKKTYVSELDKIIKQYPNTDESRRAKEMQRFLKGDETAFNDLLNKEAKQDWSTDYDKLHYGLIVIFKASNKVVNQMRIDMGKFHKKYFANDQLSTQTIPLDIENDIKLILVRSFDNKKESMKYYDVIDKKDKEFIKQKGYSFEFFVVNQSNYREIVKSKTINDYRDFFDSNYLN